MAKHKRHHSSMKHSEDRGTGMGMNREMNPMSRDFYADGDMIHESHGQDFNLPNEVMKKHYTNPSAGLPGELRYGIDEVNRNQNENHREFRKQFKLSRS